MLTPLCWRHRAYAIHARRKSRRWSKWAACGKARHPYPYEFLAALKLIPGNVLMREELAYLYIAMHHDRDAADQFEQILAITPRDKAVRDQLNACKGIKSADAPVVEIGAWQNGCIPES